MLSMNKLSLLLTALLVPAREVCALPSQLAKPPPPAAVREVYQFPNGTWIENIAVRACGDLVLTELTAPNLYLLDPARGSKPVLAQTFPASKALLGLSEIEPDVFVVLTGNSSAGAVVPGYSPIWTVDFRGIRVQESGVLNKKPKVRQIVNLANSGLLNGVVALSTAEVLISDSILGNVIRLNVDTGISTAVLSDPLMALDPASPVPLGINGIRFKGDDKGTLYFTNSGRFLFAKIAIRQDGTARSPGVVITRSPKPNPPYVYDDFALDGRGTAYLATAGGNSIERVTPRGRGAIIAGNLNSTQIAEPTSAQFGRRKIDKDVLYVTTGGGLLIPVSGDTIVGAQVVAVDTSEFRERGG